jgi:hypothetical protein
VQQAGWKPNNLPLPNQKPPPHLMQVLIKNGNATGINLVIAIPSGLFLKAATFLILTSGYS